MKKTDELKLEISSKRAALMKMRTLAKTEEDYSTLISLASELDELLARYEAERTLEETEAENFLRTARPLENRAKKIGIQGGVGGEEYRNQFFNAVRQKFRDSATSDLREGSPALGGYLVPQEFGSEILSRLEEENALRRIGETIQTSSEHAIPVVAAPPSASWFAERQLITPSDETFTQVKIGAHKLAVSVSVSNELLADSLYDLEKHLTDEFSKAFGRAEERAFLTGTGENQPTGILTTFDTDSDSYVTGTLSTETLIDDIVKLQYSVPRAYRRNASWLVSEEVIQTLRTAKDAVGRFIWQDSLSSAEPPLLLGSPIFSSPFLPPATTGNIPMLYGDFSYFKIGERGTRTMRALRETRALEDLTVFLMVERVDGVLVDKAAVKGLKLV